MNQSSITYDNEEKWGNAQLQIPLNDSELSNHCVILSMDAKTMQQG